MSSDFAALMEDAQRATGGHYASMAPEQLRETAQSDARELIAGLAEPPHVDRTAIQDTARQTDTQGIALDDLTRMSVEIERRFIAYVQAELAEQPGVCRRPGAPVPPYHGRLPQ